MKFRVIFLLTVLALTLGACSLAEDITPPPDYQSPTPPPTMGPLFPANPPDPAAGAAIYAEKCAACHGDSGLGDGPAAANLPKKPAALGSPEIAAAAVPAEWYQVVTQGNLDSFMPPFASLSDQQRWDVVAYALSLHTTPAQLAQGQTVYTANCAACHGTDGSKLAKASFSDQARMAKFSQDALLGYIEKGTDNMPSFESKLSADERAAVAAYLRTLTFVAAPLAQSAPATATQTPVATSVGSPSATTVSGTPETPLATEQAVATAGTPAEINGTISGKVSNGSGGSLPAGLTAVLHTFEHNPTNDQFSEIVSHEAPLGADGSYLFQDVSMPANRAFYVSVDYAGTSYSSDPLTPKDGQSTYDLPVTIYDTTSDASGLVADQVHILLDYSKANVIQVVEFYIISNPGTKAVVAQEKGGPVVTVTLPQGYSNLQFQDGQLGDRFVQTADGFGDTSPVIPSQQQYQLVFAYDLPYSANFEFSQPFSLQVSALTFLVSEGVSVTGQGLSDGGLRDMDNSGAKYHLYGAGSRKPGETLDVTVSGQGSQAAPATFPGGDATRNLIIGIGAFGVALILSAAWLYARDRRRGREDTDDDLDQEDAETGDLDEVLDAIIALDDQYNAGNISEEAYKQRRAELKAQLQGKV